jgi:hypothetical protein
MAPGLTPTQAVRLRVVEVRQVANMPAGLVTTTNTSAITGYYCLKGIPGSGWSIMLNAYLNNGFVIQDIIGSMTPIPLPILTNYITNIWLLGDNPRLVHARLIPIAFACGWLIIRLVNGTAFMGFSIDGRHVIWFDAYHVGDGSIIMASIVLGGPGNGSIAIIEGSLTIPLALYYWQNDSWHPATTPTPVDTNILEAVNHAWVSVSANCSSTITWPMPIAYTTCPKPPTFKG